MSGGTGPNRERRQNLLNLCGSPRPVHDGRNPGRYVGKCVPDSYPGNRLPVPSLLVYPAHGTPLQESHRIRVGDSPKHHYNRLSAQRGYSYRSQ